MDPILLKTLVLLSPPRSAVHLLLPRWIAPSSFKLKFKYGNVDNGDGHECPGQDDDDDEPNLLAADIKPLKIEHGWVLISHLNLDLDDDFDAQEFEPSRPKLRFFEEKPYFGL